MYKWEQIFLPLLEGGQFHGYLTAQVQNAVLRIFALPTNAWTLSLIDDYH